MDESCALLREKTSYLTDEEKDQLERALLFATQAHAGVERADGSPYIVHPIAVAIIVAESKLDLNTLIACLLHDTIEDCPNITSAHIEDNFGKKVAFLVDAVTKMEQYDKRIEGTEYYAKDSAEKNTLLISLQHLLLSSSEDLRGLLIKLADRIHNMRTISNLRVEKQQRIARETMDIYVPLAAILGLRGWKTELEAMAFAVLHPEDNQRIQAHLRRLITQDSEALIKEICDTFKTLLDQECIAYQEVYGRVKTTASIFRKSRSKLINMKNLMDIMAFRIILKSQRNCYRALGKLHSKFSHVVGTFDDYISAPKSNGYQSLHTVIIGPRNIRLEVQIRSAAMHKIAEKGIAAHWRYKNDLNMSEEAHHLVAQLREDIKQEKLDRIIMGEINLVDFSQEIVVYTPKGELVRLPNNSTPLDFAFRIHSQLGLQFHEAYVNNQPASMGQLLRRGDTVSIITDNNVRPKDFWLENVATHRAKNALRQWFDIQEAEELTLFLTHLAKEFGQKLTTTIDHVSMRQLYKNFQVKQLNELEERIISMKINPIDVLQAVQPELKLSNDRHSRQEHLLSTVERVLPCPYCLPLPGDALKGAWQVDKGWVAHRDNCHQLILYVQQDSAIKAVALKKHHRRQNKFLTILDCCIPNRPGLMGAICVTLGERKINIEDLTFLQRLQETISLRFYLSVQHKVQIDDVMTTLSRRNLGIVTSRPVIDNLYDTLPSAPVEGDFISTPHNDD